MLRETKSQGLIGKGYVQKNQSQAKKQGMVDV